MFTLVWSIALCTIYSPSQLNTTYVWLIFSKQRKIKWNETKPHGTSQLHGYWIKVLYIALAVSQTHNYRDCHVVHVYIHRWVVTMDSRLFCFSIFLALLLFAREFTGLNGAKQKNIIPSLRCMIHTSRMIQNFPSFMPSNVYTSMESALP